MTAKEVIEKARGFRPNAAKDEVMLSWLSELEGRVQTEIFVMDVHDIAPITDMDSELYAKYPHDAIYEAYLIMQTDLYHKEYDAFSASRMRFDELWGVFARYMATYHRPADEAKALGREGNCHERGQRYGTVQPFWNTKEAYIGANGNWWYGGLDTGIKGVGRDGLDGEAATVDVEETEDGIRLILKDSRSTNIAEIKNGITPRIENGMWYIGEKNTGIKAEGVDGYTPKKGVDYFTESEKKNFWLGAFGMVTPQMYGAKGDGKNDDTAAIQACFDKNDRIYFPPGTYRIVQKRKDGRVVQGQTVYGADAPAILELHDNMHLILDPDAIIQRYTPGEDAVGEDGTLPSMVDIYPRGDDVPNSYINDGPMIGADGKENIVIEGGKIWGNLQKLSIPQKKAHGAQAAGIRFSGCKNVLLKDVESAYHISDGLMLRTYNGVVCQNIKTPGCRFHDVYRHGIGICGCDGFLASDVRIWGVKWLDDIDFEHHTNSDCELDCCEIGSEDSGLAYRSYYGIVNNNCDGLIIRDTTLRALCTKYTGNTKLYDVKVKKLIVSNDSSCYLDNCEVASLVPASTSAVTRATNCTFRGDADDDDVNIAQIQAVVKTYKTDENGAFVLNENGDKIPETYYDPTAELYFDGCTFVSSTEHDLFHSGVVGAKRYIMDNCRFIMRSGHAVKPSIHGDGRMANCEIVCVPHDGKHKVNAPIALYVRGGDSFDAHDNVIYASDLPESYDDGIDFNMVELNAKTVRFSENKVHTAYALGKYSEAALRLGENVEQAYVTGNITPAYASDYVLAGSDTVVETGKADLSYQPESENAQSGKAVAEALAGKVGLDAWEQIGSVTLAEDVTSHRFFRGNMMRRVKIFATVPEGGSGEFYYEIACITASGTAKSNLYGRLDCTQSYAELYLEDGKLIAHAYFLDADGRTQLCSHIAPIDAIYIRDLTLRNSGTGLTGATFEVRGVRA